MCSCSVLEFALDGAIGSHLCSFSLTSIYLMYLRKKWVTVLKIIAFVCPTDVGDVTFSHIMIMSVHPILVLLPILGLLVLPCVPNHFENGFKIVANKTVNNSEECDIKLCKSISKASEISFWLIPLNCIPIIFIYLLFLNRWSSVSFKY